MPPRGYRLHQQLAQAVRPSSLSGSSLPSCGTERSDPELAHPVLSRQQALRALFSQFLEQAYCTRSAISVGNHWEVACRFAMGSRTAKRAFMSAADALPLVCKRCRALQRKTTSACLLLEFCQPLDVNVEGSRRF